MMAESIEFSSRQARLSHLLQAAPFAANRGAQKEYPFDLLALNPGPSLAYLTGLNFHLMERPVVAFFSADRQPVLVLPELEQAKLTNLTYPILAIPYSDDPATWQQAFQQAVQQIECHVAVGVEPVRMRFLELSFLEAALPAVKLVSADPVLEGLRLSKDPLEVELIQRAVEIAERALQAILPAIKPGISEKELANTLTIELLRAGSDPELPFSPIVASGPNSANPHAVPTGRRLTEGDLLIIDWGAAYQGYISDLTRTFAIGALTPEFNRIAQVVAAANEAGRKAAGPEITASEIDQAARRVITDAGYGEYFIHRTGHGIGMEAHEAPYLRAGNDLPLSPGMTFTVEPGIYLPGRGGVRIEDNVVITASGSICLSQLPREVVSLT